MSDPRLRKLRQLENAFNEARNKMADIQWNACHAPTALRLDALTVEALNLLFVAARELRQDEISRQGEKSNHKPKAASKHENLTNQQTP